MTEKELDDIVIQALLLLVKDKKLEDITISDIVAKAGIGRGTFYRHFKDKDDIISTYFTYRSESIRSSLTKMSPRTRDEYYELFFTIFTRMKEEKEMLKLVFQAGLEGRYFDLILESIQKQISAWGVRSEDVLTRFYPSFLSGALYGATKQWLTTDCEESVKSVCDAFFTYFTFPNMTGVPKSLSRG